MPRAFAALGAAAALTLLFAAPCRAAPIVFLQVDEMDGRLIDPRSALSRVVRLPTMDRLRASGVNFVNAYSESPICVSSRSTMWTGRRTDQIRTWSNVRGLLSEVGNPGTPDRTCPRIAGYTPSYCVEEGRRQNVNTTIKQAVEALGYTNPQLIGKMDIGGGMGGGFHSPRPARHDDATGAAAANCSQPGGPSCYLPDCNVHSWARPANITKPAFRPPMEWVSDSMAQPATNDARIISECLQYLATLPRAGEDAAGASQVFLYCSINAPHPPYWTNATWLRQVNHTAVAAFYDAAKEPASALTPFDWYQMRSEGVSGNETREETIALATAYLGRVAMADAMIGSVLDALDRTAAGAGASVLFVADHGEMALQHHMVEKMSMYEGSARVPFIVAGPRVPPAARGTRSEALVSLLDVFPTILGLAGVRDPAESYPFLSGSSVLPILSGPAPGWRRFVTSQFHGEESNTGAFMVRYDEDEAEGGRMWKAVFYGSRTPGYEAYVPRLFELGSDPHELRDVAPAHPGVVSRLEGMLLSLYDYQAVDQQAKQDQRSAFLQWQRLWPGDGWKAQMAQAYLGYDNGDTAKVEAWLAATNGTAEAA